MQAREGARERIRPVARVHPARAADAGGQQLRRAGRRRPSSAAPRCAAASASRSRAVDVVAVERLLVARPRRGRAGRRRRRAPCARRCPARPRSPRPRGRRAGAPAGRAWARPPARRSTSVTQPSRMRSSATASTVGPREARGAPRGRVTRMGPAPRSASSTRSAFMRRRSCGVADARLPAPVVTSPTVQEATRLHAKEYFRNDA